MTKDFSEFRQDLYNLVEKSENIVITAHVSPDDDSIGSVLSLYQILKNKYEDKDIRIVYEGTIPERFSPIDLFSEIKFVEDLSQEIKPTDLLIVLDVSRLSRVSKNSEGLVSIKNTICIDHHATKPDNFSIVLIDPDFSSNSELIFRIFEDDDIEINKTLASSLLLGILGDTGNFAYLKPHQTEVFILAKRLIEILGVSIDYFRSRYGGISKDSIFLIKELVNNISFEEIGEWSPFLYSFFSREFIEENNLSDEQISEASHIFMRQYLTKISGYPWGFVITPRNDGACRISARSLPRGANVRLLFEEQGIGGGHDLASGAQMTGEQGEKIKPEDCIARLLEWIKNNKPASV